MKTNKQDIAKAMGVSIDMEKPKSTITLTDSDYKDIGNLKLDQEVELYVKGKVVSISRDRYGDKSKSCVVEIQSVEPDSEEDSEETGTKDSED